MLGGCDGTVESPRSATLLSVSKLSASGFWCSFLGSASHSTKNLRHHASTNAGSDGSSGTTPCLSQLYSRYQTLPIIPFLLPHKANVLPVTGHEMPAAKKEPVKSVEVEQDTVPGEKVRAINVDHLLNKGDN